MKIRGAMLAAVVVMAGGLFAGAHHAPAMAQTAGQDGQMFGDWKLRCETPPGAPREICAILQIADAQDRQNVSLAVAVRKMLVQQGGQVRQIDSLRIQTPVGVLLGSGVGLLVDNEEVGNVPYTRCVPNACVVEAHLTPELLARFKSGSEAIFTIFQTPEDGIGVPISLNGFSAAYDMVK